MTQWVTDQRGNRASVEFWGSEKAARNSLKLLVNCENCTNCSECISCKNCTECSNCVECEDCTGCRNCEKCVRCTDCRFCSKCNDCEGCSRARGCDTSVIVSPFRSDGHHIVVSKNGKVHAACHNFNNLAAARAYWTAARGDTPLGKETQKLLDFIEDKMKDAS